MRQRVFTALVMAVVMIPILIIGNTYQLFNLLCLAMLVLAGVEFRNMLKKKHALPFWIDVLVVLLTVLVGASIYLDLSQISSSLFLIIVLGSMLSLFIVWVFIPQFNSADFGGAILGILYISIGFASIALLRDMGIFVLVYLLLVTMLTDTFAYLFGIKFGKHRLAVNISPKKSIEGAIAGLIFGGILSTVFAYFLNVFDFHILYVLLLSFGLSVLSQIGDLVASKFKREAGIKDFSNLLPGHGGIMDRFDSLLFSSAYLILLFLVIELI